MKLTVNFNLILAVKDLTSGNPAATKVIFTGGNMEELILFMIHFPETLKE